MLYTTTCRWVLPFVFVHMLLLRTQRADLEGNQVLLLSHPAKSTRDTSSFKPLQELAKTKRPSLRNLAKLVLNIDIQSGEHSSVRRSSFFFVS